MNFKTLASYFRKQIYSFKYAFAGLSIMLKDYNIYIHIPAAFLAIGSSWWFELSYLEWIAIFSAIVLVWITEILNTALEKLVDLVSPEKNKLAGQIKDLAAGSVLIAAFYALLVGIFIFSKKIATLF